MNNYIWLGILVLVAAGCFMLGTYTVPAQTTCISNEIAGGDIAGFYDNFSGVLVVNTKGVVPARVEEVLLHELGHYYYQLMHGTNWAQGNSEDYANEFMRSHAIVKR